MFAFLKPKRAEVLGHWYTPVPNFTLSPQEFYAGVQEELRNRKVPGMDISKVEFGEGGILSERRTYLRMTRERLVFDICAAPFGTDYFFSCRLAELPAVVKLWQLIALGAGLFFCAWASFRVCVALFGLQAAFVWPIASIAAIAASIYVMRNCVAMGLTDLDTTLIKTPIIGPVYEAWFRKETYFREDARLMYMTVVDGIVKRLVEEETAIKGVKILTQYEYAPILRDIYKPSLLATHEELEPA